MRNMWLSIDERLCTYDELNMASTRLRFMTPVEILTTREIPYAINPCNVSTVHVIWKIVTSLTNPALPGPPRGHTVYS